MTQHQHPESLIDKLAASLNDDGSDLVSPSDDVETDDAVRFTDLALPEVLCRALTDSGYTHPTTVQSLAIPAAMNGADLKVASQTGSGKTAAFMLPALARILAARGDNNKRREKGVVQGPRVLVLTPTRELAMQVAKAASTYGKHVQGLRVATIVGGVPYGYQLKALNGPLDVLIATPGRLLDHLGSGAAVLKNLEVLVLDEADRMLDMGFIEDIEAIAEQTPAERLTWMFSATFAGHVGQLAQRMTRNAQDISVTSHTDSHDNIEQRLHLADSLNHKNELLDHVLTTREVDQAVVFTSTQRDADVLAMRLADMGHAVAALHGGMPQGRRNRVLQALRSRQLRVLVATDVAARGIDVPTITHVINYGMPMKAEDYVHRIGRTGRGGRSGLAVTLAERRDIPMVRRIERFTTQRIPEATIAGLEPKMSMPQDRGGPRFGAKPGRGGPRFGDGRGDSRGPRHGGEGRFQGERSFGDRFQGDRFQGERGHGDRFGDSPARAPRDAQYDPRSTSRFNQNGDPRFDRQGEAPSGDQGAPFRPRHEQRPMNSREQRRSEQFGDRNQGAWNDRPAKPFGDRPRGDRPFGDRAFGDRPQGDRPYGDRPSGDRSFGDKPFKGKSFGDKAFGEKPFGDRAFGDKPHGAKPFGKPTGGKPAGKSFGQGFDKGFGSKPGFKHGGKPGAGKRPGFGKREG